MKTKTKKIIIIIASVVVVVLGALIGVVVVSNLATTTVSDLRILDAVSSEEISEKNVYLTAKDDNFFDIKLKTAATMQTGYVVLSSDTSIATVSKTTEGYRVYYNKAGKVRIVATTQEVSDVKDTIIVTVNEFVPTKIVMTDEKALAENRVEMFSDNREYRFNFEALQGNSADNINISSVKVVDNYDKSVFSSVSIDDVNSQLVIVANQSETARNEIITLQTVQADDEGNVKSVKNFIIEVELKGNFISDIQLMISTTPNFVASEFIYGTGILNDGEKRVDAVYLTETIHMLYAKARVVYTNGEMFDVTNGIISKAINCNPKISRPQLSDYFCIDIRNETTPGSGIYTYETATIKFSYAGKEDGITLTFNYLKEGEQGYINFVNNKLYNKITGYDENTYYEYVYWDTRFLRTDAITDEEGRIVAFVDKDFMKEY